jgi:CubicO group peptidase (beta-lactamase class C family)
MSKDIDDYVEQHRGSAPALALAIIKDGALAHMGGFGVTGVEDYALPVTPDTLFCIGSTSKTLTGTMIMRLVERGLLDLDRPIRHYLPTLALHEPGATAAITLRHLLSHTSGLASAYSDYGPRDPGGLAAFVREELPGYQLVARPGQVHFYSNAGLDLAGHIAETVSGIYFPLLVEREVFQPLGMRRSTFDRNVALTYPMALPHRRAADGALKVEHRLVDNTPGNPAGFAISSVRDLARLALMFINDGAAADGTFLSGAAVREMQRPQADPHNIFCGRKYGLTFFTDHRYKGARLVQHGGSMMSYACRFVLLPERRGAVVALTNWSDNFWPLINGVIDRVFALEGGPHQPSPAPDEPARWPGYAGDYLHVEEGHVSIAIDSDRLTLQRLGQAAVALTSVEGGAFLAEHAGVVFVGGQGEPADFVVIDEQPFRRSGPLIDQAALDPELLAGYAGTYWAESAWEGRHDPVELLVRDGRLYIAQEGEERPCYPLSPTRFVSAWGSLELGAGLLRQHNSIVKRKADDRRSVL